MNTNKLLLELIATLELERKGFQLMKPLDPEDGYWYKQTDKARYIFVCSIVGYRIHGFGGFIFLSEVENILQPLLLEYSLATQEELDEYSIHSIKLMQHDETSSSIREEIEEIRLHSKEDFQKAATLMSKIIDMSIMPFWEKYSQIQVINDEIIEKVDQFKLSDYIYKWQNLKKMIIMKLCNNPDYNEYVEWHNKVTEQCLIEGDKYTSEKELKFYIELPKILEKL